MKNIEKTTRIVADLPIRLNPAHPHTPSVQDFDFDKAIIEGSKLAEEQLSFGAVRKFPLEVYPPFYQDFVKTCNKTLLHPIDFIASAILWTVAAATGNSLKVHVKNLRFNKANLFMCLVGRPNVMKTEPMQIASLPLQDRNREEFKKYINEQEKYGEKAAPIKRYLVTDYTPETYQTYLNDNPHGCSVIVDEFAGHVGNYGRYSGSSEVGMWLSIWSGVPLQVDRKGRKEEIDNPFGCVMGSTQYDILKTIFKTKSELTQNGYFDRVLFVAPNGLKKEQDNDLELPIEIYNEYKKIIYKIIDDVNSFREDFKADKEKNIHTRTLKINAEAKKIIGHFKETLRLKINKEGNSKIQSMLGKYDILIYRFALILQVMYWSCHEEEIDEIGVKAAQGAIELALYFIDNATKIHSFTTDKTAAVKLESDVLKWYNSLPRNLITIDQAMKLAAKMRQQGATGLSESYIYVYLRRGDLFEKVSRGVYDRVS